MMSGRLNPSERDRNSCKLCHGDPFICERVGSECPVRKKLRTFGRISELLNQSEFFGASPPSVFVGSWNYPKVYAGPLVPPGERGDTSEFVNEASWLNRPIEDIVDLRMMLFRGKRTMRVSDAADPGTTLNRMQELAMSARPIDTELSLVKRPNFLIQLLTRAPPSGPSGFLNRLMLAENSKVPRPVEKTVGDTDLDAGTGVVELYSSGKVSQSHITNLFSIGLLGRSKTRRLVPTQWSITAVDDILSRKLRDKVKYYESIDKFQVLHAHGLSNTAVALLAPGSFAFEVLEGWNTEDGHFSLGQDYELYRGRKSYASVIAGAYYAARLAILEYLQQIRRKATVMIFLEVNPGWIPLGVWRFRELLRRAAQEKVQKFETLAKAKMVVNSHLRRPLRDWLVKSKLLPYMDPRAKLDRFFS